MGLLGQNEKLKSLCCSNGWSYGVFWRFDQQNQMSLTVEDAYFEELMGVLLNDLLFSTHILGEGVVGRGASTGKHEWFVSDNYGRESNYNCSVGSRELLQVDSEIGYQFSLGIKTIAVIPVQSQGVVQFGSTRKISETEEFLEQTRRLFEETKYVNKLALAGTSLTSMNSQTYDLGDWFTSLCNGDVMPMDGSSFNRLMDDVSASLNLIQSPAFTTQVGQETMSPLFQSSSDVQVTFSGDQIPSVSTWSNEGSILTSIESQLFNDSEILQDATSLPGFSKEFKIDDLTIDVLDTFIGDNLFDLFPTSPNNIVGGITAMKTANLSPPLADTPLEQSTDSLRSLITDSHFCSGKQKSDIANDAEGIKILTDKFMPVFSGSNSGISASIPETSVDLQGAPRKGLFSELGIIQLLDSFSNSNYDTKSSIEDELSTAKRRRTESSSVASNQFQSYHGGTMTNMSCYTMDKTNNVFSKKEVLPKSQGSLCIDDSYSVNNGNGTLSKPEKSEEPTKGKKKRARPGEGTRPRPKDRQMIQDHLKELRGLIPDGQKCSIDGLLDRTVKHMLFLQSITTYADKLKQLHEPKLTGPASRMPRNSNNGIKGGGATWAVEVGDQTTVCPVIVEDLGPPGLMLVEMLCEDQGFFLEIADVIKGLGLNVVKGVMETQDGKIWAHFIVEASTNITRIDVLWFLLQNLERTATTGTDLTGQSRHLMNDTIPPINNFQQPMLQHPMMLQ